MLCDGRMVCGCADPYGKRVLGDTRVETVSAIWTGERASGLRRDLNAGGSKFCGDCPLKLPLEERRDAAACATSTSRRCRRGCTSSARPPATSRAHRPAARPETGITRTRQAGMLDFELFRRVIDEAGPSLGPRRLLQLRRSVPAQARDRDVRVHQGALSRTSTSTRAPTARLHRGAGAAARALGHRRGHVLDRRRHRGELRRSTGSAATSTRRSAT